MPRLLGEQLEHDVLENASFEPAGMAKASAQAGSPSAGPKVSVSVHAAILFDISLPVKHDLWTAAAGGEERRVRLDKFLKVSRLSKRRSEAHEALEHGRITKNGKALKPGYQVKPGDVLEIHYATRYVTVTVRDVPLRVTPAVKPADLYDVIETRRDEPSDWI